MTKPFEVNFLNIRRLQRDYDEIDHLVQSNLRSSEIQEKAYQMGLAHALANDISALKLHLTDTISKTEKDKSPEKTEPLRSEEKESCLLKEDKNDKLDTIDKFDCKFDSDLALPDAEGESCFFRRLYTYFIGF